MGEQTFFRNFLGGCFTWGLMISDHARVELMLNRAFKGRVKLVFPVIDAYWVIDIFFEKLTPQIGD